MKKKNAKSAAKRGARTAPARAPERKRPAVTRRPKRSAPARPPAPEPVADVVDAEPVSALLSPSAAPPPDIPLSIPEPAFADRVLPSEPERPMPAARRAIFFDVENTSRPEHIARVVEHLAVDRLGKRTDFVAVGNWRVIGHDTARLLARHGAHLVHSAPSVGVRDWSDLRIAVAAGVWLAGARPGDVLEIVTNDRAFDAVGDVASSLGIAFRRLSHQGLPGAVPERESAASDTGRESHPDGRQHRRGGRGRRRGGWRGGSRHAPAAPAAPAPEPAPSEEPIVDISVEAPAPPPQPPHTAPHDEIVAIVHELIERSPTRSVTLDTLANALKARGFSRTPGSPRLITRLRRIREVSVSRSGVITEVDGHGRSAPAEAAMPVPEEIEPAVLDEEADAGPGPGNEKLPAAEPVHASRTRRRRSRRGGRGHRPQSHHAPAV